MMNCEYKNVYMWLLLMPFILEGCWDSSVDYRQIESSTSSKKQDDICGLGVPELNNVGEA